MLVDFYDKRWTSCNGHLLSCNISIAIGRLSSYKNKKSWPGLKYYTILILFDCCTWFDFGLQWLVTLATLNWSKKCVWILNPHQFFVSKSDSTCAPDQMDYFLTFSSFYLKYFFVGEIRSNDSHRYLCTPPWWLQTINRDFELKRNDYKQNLEDGVNCYVHNNITMGAQNRLDNASDW